MVRSDIHDRNILFLCPDNGCLSFIAEAIAKQLSPPQTEIFSAGRIPGEIASKAVEVLREIGIDVSAKEAKGLDCIPIQDIDLIITLGNQQDTRSGFSSRATWRAWDIPDPRRDPGANL